MIIMIKCIIFCYFYKKKFFNEGINVYLMYFYYYTHYLQEKINYSFFVKKKLRFFHYCPTHCLLLRLWVDDNVGMDYYLILLLFISLCFVCDWLPFYPFLYRISFYRSRLLPTIQITKATKQKLWIYIIFYGLCMSLEN